MKDQKQKHILKKINDKPKVIGVRTTFTLDIKWCKSQVRTLKCQGKLDPSIPSEEKSRKDE